VKMSRRFIPCHDWIADLQGLADESQMPTFSQSCDHFNFGFRTECIGFHCKSWRRAGAYDKIKGQVERNEPVFVEGFIHDLARQVAKGHSSRAAHAYMLRNPRSADRDGYAPWPIMPNRRTVRSPWLLWHDSDGVVDYCRAAALRRSRRASGYILVRCRPNDVVDTKLQESVCASARRPFRLRGPKGLGASRLQQRSDLCNRDGGP
jgi:hypothetical protein